MNIVPVEMLSREQLLDLGFLPAEEALRRTDSKNGLGFLEEFRFIESQELCPTIVKGRIRKPWYRQGEKY